MIFLSFCTLTIGVICTESVMSAVLWEFTVFKFQALREGLAVESFLAGYRETSIYPVSNSSWPLNRSTEDSFIQG